MKPYYLILLLLTNLLGQTQIDSILFKGKYYYGEEEKQMKYLYFEGIGLRAFEVYRINTCKGRDLEIDFIYLDDKKNIAADEKSFERKKLLSFGHKVVHKGRIEIFNTRLDGKLICEKEMKYDYVDRNSDWYQSDILTFKRNQYRVKDDDLLIDDTLEAVPVLAAERHKWKKGFSAYRKWYFDTTGKLIAREKFWRNCRYFIFWARSKSRVELFCNEIYGYFPNWRVRKGGTRGICF